MVTLWVGAISFTVLVVFLFWWARRPYPLVRLRRDADNAERDFYAKRKSRVSGPPAVANFMLGLDCDAIDEWAGGSALFCVVWYNQAPKSLWARFKDWRRGREKHLTQMAAASQPKFVPFSPPNLQFEEGEHLKTETDK